MTSHLGCLGRLAGANSQLLYIEKNGCAWLSNITKWCRNQWSKEAKVNMGRVLHLSSKHWIILQWRHLIDITPLETALHLDHSKLNEPFSRKEVEAAILNQKAPGHNEIGASFIKNSICIPFLQTLFNTCLRLGETPLAWGKSYH